MMLRFSLALLLTLSAAYADVIDPERTPAAVLKGAECMVVGGISGTCQPAECCRNDYSNGTPRNGLRRLSQVRPQWSHRWHRHEEPRGKR